ncbi:hypothetical protein AMS68_007446 [Peltaster fructicola]|uniref:Uncharacterized protein n=1 Tax=Peltaster fructicola TaxID=286661 RepID=A0A6H0Y521_9PEZI|nr:hypothetical protein AMS68_007446 [Peltaster fructicola]
MDASCNAPHPHSAFEGYYSKFDLPSGAHITIIVSTVRKVKTRPHVVSFSYIPRDVSKTFQREVCVDDITMRALDDKGAFELVASDVGYVRWTSNNTTEYKLHHEDFTFEGKTRDRTPWSTSTQTPEWLLAYLPLPLHWHVHNLGSTCDFTFKIPSSDLPSSDLSGQAFVHQEKNWAHSFPAAQVWIQARDGDRRFCCAGGPTMGMEAFLIGYRSKQHNFDFRPPFSLRVAGMSPFMWYKQDWETRSFQMSVQDFWRKIEVKIRAPKGTFFSLSAPFSDGHRPNFLGESFQAVLDIKIYEATLFSWKLVGEDHFESVSLEFGGDYYPPRGSERRIN